MITIKCSWCPGPMYTFTLHDSMLVRDFLTTVGKGVLGTRKIEDADISIQSKLGGSFSNIVGRDVLVNGDIVILKDKYERVFSDKKHTNTLWERVKMWILNQWYLWRC